MKPIFLVLLLCLCGSVVLADSPPTATPKGGTKLQSTTTTRIDGESSASNLQVAQGWLDLLVAITTVGGVPIAIWLFVADRRKERRTRTLDAYLEASNRYNEFLNRVFDHPELDCGEFRADDPEVADSEMSVQKLTLFTQLILTLERAWFVYEIYDVKSQKANDDLCDVWNTWTTAFDFWARRPDFQKAWKYVDPNTPNPFSKHMTERIAHFRTVEAKQSHPPEPAAGSV